MGPRFPLSSFSVAPCWRLRVASRTRAHLRSRARCVATMGIAFKTLIVTLMAYFVLMSLTVERAYCNAPLEPSSTVPFVPEAVAFCAKANPLFLQRPEWLRLATCFSAYGLCPFYLLIGATALLDAWVRMLPCLITQGEGDARSRRRCAR